MNGVRCIHLQYGAHEVDPNHNGHGSKDHGCRMMVVDPDHSLRDGVVDHLGRMNRGAHGCRKDHHEVGMVVELDCEQTWTTVLKVGLTVTHGMRKLDRWVARGCRSEGCRSQELKLNCREHYVSRHCDIPLYDLALRMVEIGGVEGYADDMTLVHAHAVVILESESKRGEVGISRDSLGNEVLVAHDWCGTLENVFQSHSLLQVYLGVSVAWSDVRSLVKPYGMFAQPDAQVTESAPEGDR